MLIFVFSIIACTSNNEEDYFHVVDCETENLFYKTTSSESISIKSIIDNKCAGCHSIDNMANVQYVTLEEYTSIQEYDIYAAINNSANPMPPLGSSQLTECEKLQIETWIDNALPYDEKGR